MAVNNFINLEPQHIAVISAAIPKLLLNIFTSVTEAMGYVNMPRQSG